MLKGMRWVAWILVLAPLLSAEPDEGFSFDGALKRLGHEEFKERVAAQDDLREWGEQRVDEGIQVFYQLFRTHDDPEIRWRCRELLKVLVTISLADQGEGYIGISMEDQLEMKPGERPRYAVRITKVQPGTPAERAKLRKGDLVTGIDDMRFGQLKATTAFGQYVRSKKPTQTITLQIMRGGEAMEQKVELMKRPPGLDERMFLPFGEEFVPPTQAEVEEGEFREWLKVKIAEEAMVPAAEPDVDDVEEPGDGTEPLEKAGNPD